MKDREISMPTGRLSVQVFNLVSDVTKLAFLNTINIQVGSSLDKSFKYNNRCDFSTQVNSINTHAEQEMKKMSYSWRKKLAKMKKDSEAEKKHVIYALDSRLQMFLKARENYGTSKFCFFSLLSLQKRLKIFSTSLD